MNVSTLRKILKRFHGNTQVHVYVTGSANRGDGFWEEVEEPTDCVAVMDGEKLVLKPNLISWEQFGKCMRLDEDKK